MKRNLLIGSIVSAFFLYLALRDIEWDVLWGVLRETRLSYLLPAVVVSLVSHYFRAYRWKFMLLPVKTITTNSLFSATMIGLMGNNLLPARLGEIVRAYALGRREQISRTAAFATIVYERIVDVFSLLVLLWIVLAKIPGPDWLGRSALWLLVANVLLMFAMIAMERHRGLVTRLVARASRRLSENTQAKIQQATEGYLGGLAGMMRPRTLLPIAVTSVATWGFAMFAVYLCFGALGIDVPVMASATLVVVIAMGSMIPSAPAHLGTTQYACVLGLGLFGIGKSEALAYSILFHALQFFPVTILGLYYLWRAEIRLRDISSR
ncbi:MAG: flippase-like domain-containing protein [Candidatus Latescibacterota bacterium]|nr:MAG: flippase-like domain-containing protein [Candidatus Latescibacterota bacterium]